MKIGLWCNGNTTDSGPVFPGSNPGSPTEKECHEDVMLFLFFLITCLEYSLGYI